MREDSYILIGIHRIVKDLDRETARVSSSYGLTFPQFMVLEALLNKGSLTVGEIKEKILSSNGTIPVIINNLVKQGMVRRTKDPDDQRRSLVELTDKGRELIERVYPENEKIFTERFGIWTKEEKKELMSLIGRYHEHFLKRRE
ncbi:MAG: MarR family transcriptional regulator [Lachnospiraceae bacterium]|nr:MarR family transcriptional regulator [Lachnospiraceae bacterium]